MTTLAEIATILQTSEKNLKARVLKMRLGETCSRCCGSGQYSFNQTDGTRCYGCEGLGNVMPKAAGLPALKLRAEAAVADGSLARYLDNLRAAKAVKGALDRVFGAWKTISEPYPYDWMKAVEDKRAGVASVDLFRSDQNAIVAAAYEAFKPILDAYQSPRKDVERPAATVVEAELAKFLAVVAEVRAVVAAHAAEHPEEHAAAVAAKAEAKRRHDARMARMWGG